MSDAEGPRAGREEVWIEKYRPRRLADVVGQEAIVERLESYVSRDDLPHMLFAGQAGIGKCATGETPVLTSDGLARMETIVGDVEGFQSNRDGTRVLTLTDAGEFEYVTPSHLFGKTADRVVDVQTRDGVGLTVTPEHKLLVCTSEGFVWREAHDLDEGDRIVRPLEAPLPETNASLPWVEGMDADRTLVSVDEAFARRHDIPVEEQYVGTKRGVVRGLRHGLAPAEIADLVGTSRKNVNRIRRELGDIDLSATSSVCSLEYLRSLDCSRAELQKHVTAIRNVAPSNNSRSAPITPVWTVEPRLARLLGLLIAEGRLDGRKVKFYNANERLLEFVERALTELFDVDAARGTQQGVGYVKVGNKTLSNFLRASFDVFDGATGGDGIGSTILAAPDDARAAFLGAMFDAEGHVTPHGVIELTQKDGDIVTLLSYLLAGFGIPSRRTEVEKRATNGTGPARTYHTLLLSSAGHLERFRQLVGFSIRRKADRLERAAARPGNPNFDTLPDQQVVDELCTCLNIAKGEFFPTTLDADAHARADYVDRLESLLSTANQRLETVQEVLVQLDGLQPTLERAASVPAEWAAARADLEPLEVRRSVAEEHSVRSDRLLEYARGDRTPYARRAEAPLATVEVRTKVPDIEDIQGVLKGVLDRLDIPLERIAERTDLHGSEVGNLLEGSDHKIRSMTRFRTVADALRAEVASMASRETVAHLNTLDWIVSTDAYLDEVQTVIERDGERRVYDLTVPETHNYVAGSVPTVMHNTTAAQAVARELYGEGWEEHFLELNASDERGIDVVRDRIKSFARTSFGGANYRIIFLDEADALTSDAQSALRRTMEQFSTNVRFILSCNYSSQIIDPIQSRCAVFRFSPLSDAAVEEQLRRIADEEGIELAQDGIDALVYAADGDMRRAINGLQAAAVTGGEVDGEAVYEITSTARPEEIREMVTRALEGDFTGARSELDRLLTEEGIAGGDILDQLHRAVWEFDLDDEAAVRVLDRIGEADYRITEGANERVQLEALLASLALER